MLSFHLRDTLSDNEQHNHGLRRLLVNSLCDVCYMIRHAKHPCESVLIFNGTAYILSWVLKRHFVNDLDDFQQSLHASAQAESELESNET